jgi:hypothetical protein
MVVKENLSIFDWVKIKGGRNTAYWRVRIIGSVVSRAKYDAKAARHRILQDSAENRLDIISYRDTLSNRLPKSILAESSGDSKALYWRNLSTEPSKRTGRIIKERSAAQASHSARFPIRKQIMKRESRAMSRR